MSKCSERPLSHSANPADPGDKVPAIAAPHFFVQVVVETLHATQALSPSLPTDALPESIDLHKIVDSNVNVIPPSLFWYCNASDAIAS